MFKVKKKNEKKNTLSVKVSVWISEIKNYHYLFKQIFSFFLLFPELYQIWQNLKGAGEYNSEDIVFITMKMCRLLSTDNKCYKNVIIGCIGSLMNNHTAMLFHTLLMNKIG